MSLRLILVIAEQENQGFPCNGNTYGQIFSWRAGVCIGRPWFGCGPAYEGATLDILPALLSQRERPWAIGPLSNVDSYGVLQAIHLEE